MAKTNTRKYIIYGSIATIVGVIGYYIWKSSKKDEKPKDETPAPDNDGNQKDGKVNETPVKDNSSNGTPAPTGAPAGLDVARFQEWVWSYPEYELSSTNPSETDSMKRMYKSTLCRGNACVYKTAVDGLWGQGTSQAWDLYYKYWNISKNNPTELGKKTYPLRAGSKFGSSTVTTPTRKPQLYATKGAPIYNTLTDFIPYRYTSLSSNEYVGESLGVVTHKGESYYKLAWDRGEVKYILVRHIQRVVK
jgi:hypothetical protein